MSSARCAAAVLVLGALIGCRSGDRPVEVKGNVTFQTKAVTEGTVQFNDAKTGRGAEAELGADGSYKATLPAGGYAVVILPPLLMVESKGGPVNPEFKKVGNIPDKYRSTATSGLRAEVSADKAVHNFEMKP